jgi:hypothetical protein
MVGSRNSGLQYFVVIRGVDPRIEGFDVFSPLDKMLLNTTSVKSTYYCSYLELGLGCYNDLGKFVIVKFTFNWTIPPVR